MALASSIASAESPWAIVLRSQVNRRRTLIWLEIARRAEIDKDYARAGEALEHAQLGDLPSDFVARAAMQYAFRIGDRAFAIRCYLRYQQALDEHFGVEPAQDLQLLYRQALEP